MRDPTKTATTAYHSSKLGTHIVHESVKGVTEFSIPEYLSKLKQTVSQTCHTQNAAYLLNLTHSSLSFHQNDSKRKEGNKCALWQGVKQVIRKLVYAACSSLIMTLTNCTHLQEENKIGVIILIVGSCTSW